MLMFEAESGEKTEESNDKEEEKVEESEDKSEKVEEKERWGLFHLRFRWFPARPD